MSRVLVVEDNEMNLDMLCRRLIRKGYDIITAVNGEEALEVVSNRLPDIILMDMSLPVMDGWQATKHLKTQPETSHIPIIGLSAHALDSDIIKGKESGCDAYETKPVNLPVLLATIESLLGTSVTAQGHT